MTAPIPTAARAPPGRPHLASSQEDQVPITEHDKPVYKLTCSNEHCTSDDWTALDEDGHTKYFDSHAHAREWGGLNGWSVDSPVLCPADAADAREQREQAEDIAAAVADALAEG